MTNNIFQIMYETPWKLFNELLMYLFKPFVYIYLKLNGVVIGKGFKFYGFPKIYKNRESKIIIGNNFESRNWWFSNPLGINHPLILCTWSKNAEIKIGNDVGISGGSIVSAKGINIGDRVLIGANSTIIDTDFHPVIGEKRYSKNNIKTKNIYINNDVFIGMNVIILKGVKIKDYSVIPAGEVVR
jgi:acetyltransferase-like isoleucine patch superfamily enzyme